MRATRGLKHLPRDTFFAHLRADLVSTHRLLGKPPVVSGWHGTRSLWQPPYGIGRQEPSDSLKQLEPLTMSAPLTGRRQTWMQESGGDGGAEGGDGGDGGVGGGEGGGGEGGGDGGGEGEA